MLRISAVKLPGMSRIVLTQDVDLFSVSKGDPLPAIRDFAALNKLGELLAPSPGLNVGNTYVRFHVSGFASSFLDSSALASGYSRFRQLVQLAVSLGLFQGDRSARFYPRSSLSSEVFVYGDPDEPSERKSITLPFSVSHFAAILTLDESRLTVPGGLHGPDRPALTQEERTAAIARLLQHGLLLLDADDSDESANAIRAALEWGFEAATNQNETFAVCTSLYRYRSCTWGGTQRGDERYSATGRPVRLSTWQDASGPNLHTQALPESLPDSLGTCPWESGPAFRNRSETVNTGNAFTGGSG